MNIRPKNIIKAVTGVKFSSANANGANWRQLVFENYRLHLLDQLTAYGEGNDYGLWLNEMLSRHSKLHNAAGGASGNWLNIAYENPDVGKYLLDYRGGLGNNGQYQRFGTVAIKDSDRYDFNLTGIKPNLSTRYTINNPPSRTSGDFSRTGYNYNIDNYYSAITDDRRLLGRKGDWDENELNKWNDLLKSTGWKMYLDSDDYYKLLRIPQESPNNPPSLTVDGGNPLPSDNLEVVVTGLKKDPASVGVGPHSDRYGFDWNKLREGLAKVTPDLIEVGRLAGTLATNDKIYDAKLKGIRPNLLLTYNTYRQVVGDEATKLGYYRRAAEGITRASRPFTSDADRQTAYMMEAQRVANDLRAQGDLADNLRIRETSDLSSQHADANTQRATEVANRNIIELNNANAAKLDIIAQKYGANWSSVDNFLQGIGYRTRLRQAEDLALDDQIWALLRLNDIQNDSIIEDYTKKYNEALEKSKDASGVYNMRDPEVQKWMKLIRERLTQLAIETYRLLQQRKRGIFSAKSGTKITHKKKEDLLYKSAKDVVEHFRKMSKMSNDSTLKSRTKPIKLSPHPKSKTRKMLQGGVAPFMIYKPIAIGGETTTQSSSEGRSSKESKSESKILDVLKNLFGDLKGLPADVNGVYTNMMNFLAKSQAFGTEISTEDLASIYLQLMQQINNIKFSKERYDLAELVATSNDALGEFAVTSNGGYVVQKEDGSIGFASLDEIKKNRNLNPLTNSLLLGMRAHDPNMALTKGDAFMSNIVQNAVGMSKVVDYIKKFASGIGSTELVLEGYTKHEAGKIEHGLQLLQEAPSGDYSYTNKTKEQTELMKAALDFITKSLPKNYRAVLEINAVKEGVTGNELIASYLGGQTSLSRELNFTAVTGKAAKDKEDDLSKVSSNPLLAMLREIGGNYLNYSIISKDSNTRLSVNGTFYSALPKVNEDMSVDKMLSTSGINGIILGKRGITFGNQEIKPEDLKHVMYSDNGGMVVTLPCKIVNGIKQVNLDIIDAYERAELKALQTTNDRNSLEFVRVLANELKNEHLDSLLDSNGLPNKNMFGLFLIVEGYTSDKIKFDTNSKYIEKVENPDEELEQRISKALSTDNKKSDYSLDIKDHWTLFEGGWDDIYRGTIFIPLNNNPNAAINSWGGTSKIGESTELEELYQISNKSSNFNKNNTLE